ncbi:hypothetical protein [Bradyrhizobium diazoefficiens]
MTNKMLGRSAQARVATGRRPVVEIPSSSQDQQGVVHADNPGGAGLRTSSRPIAHGLRPHTAVMNFIEGARAITESELQANNITQYHATNFYRDQITNSGYYDQLKYIVEPTIAEFKSPGSLDTSGEHDNTVVPGLQHKYAQTGLLLVTDRCASYCRYCFRKRIVGKDSDEIAPDFARVAQYIAGHPEMTNVLLSGGDPFVLSTAKLGKILDHLLPIPHLESIRFGTKIVAFAPRRFEDPALPALFRRISEAGKTAVIVAHFDHIGEISVDAERNIRALRAQGVQFLNQSVLSGESQRRSRNLGGDLCKVSPNGRPPLLSFSRQAGERRIALSGLAAARYRDRARHQPTSQRYPEDVQIHHVPLHGEDRGSRPWCRWPRVYAISSKQDSRRTRKGLFPAARRGRLLVGRFARRLRSKCARC